MHSVSVSERTGRAKWTGQRRKKDREREREKNASYILDNKCLPFCWSQQHERRDSQLYRTNKVRAVVCFLMLYFFAKHVMLASAATAETRFAFIGAHTEPQQTTRRQTCLPPKHMYMIRFFYRWKCITFNTMIQFWCEIFPLPSFILFICSTHRCTKKLYGHIILVCVHCCFVSHLFLLLFQFYF